MKGFDIEEANKLLDFGEPRELYEYISEYVEERNQKGPDSIET